MKLQNPAPTYTPRAELERNRAIEAADRDNRKKMQDVEITSEERLILSSPDGTRWKITVDNAGTISATSL